MLISLWNIAGISTDRLENSYLAPSKLTIRPVLFSRELIVLYFQYWLRLPDSHFGVENFNSMRPRQNGRLFADDTFKRIFLNENIRISTKNSLKCVPKGLINNIPALVLIMAWRRPGDKPLSEPILVRSLTHICVTRPQWVNWATMITWARHGPKICHNECW